MNEVSKLYHLKLLHIATKLVFNVTFEIKQNRILFLLIISYQAGVKLCQNNAFESNTHLSRS